MDYERIILVGTVLKRTVRSLLYELIVLTKDDGRWTSRIMIFRTESELPENSVQYILVTTIITRYCTVVDRTMHGVLLFKSQSVTSNIWIFRCQKLFAYFYWVRYEKTTSS